MEYLVQEEILERQEILENRVNVALLELGYVLVLVCGRHV